MSFQEFETGSHRGSRGVDGDSSYIRNSGTVAGLVTQMSNNVNSIRALVSKIGTHEDTHELRENLYVLHALLALGMQPQGLISGTTALAKKGNESLFALKDAGHGDDLEERLRNQQRQKLSSDFKRVLSQFQSVAKEASRKEKAYIARARSSSGDRRTFDEEAPGTINTDQADYAEQEQEVMFNEAVLRERQEGIKEIENTILEVNDIFRDLSSIVHEQQEQFDNIEDSITNSLIQSDQAVTQLEKASTYRSRSRKRKLCLLFCLVVVIAVLVIIFAKPK